MNKNELLLPVGNYQMCLAAIHNGADAIYVGMPEFNARGRSTTHSWDELKEIIDICHLYGVKVNLAFNILIFQNEIKNAIDVLDKAVALGPDALIIQDLGLAKIVSTRYPEQIIHASTQMTITSHEAIELVSDLNIKRFVLGRENTIDEISFIKSNTNKELEVFVHGALCVAYSGQCFTSESLGGRSANRGQCAQSCRFDYELYVDGKKKNLVDKKYLVSPKDLCGINEIPRLVDIGVDSFKVEGRLKSPEFVGTVARSYRQKIDNPSASVNKLIQDMEVTYSRGFYPGWLNGVAHQELVTGMHKSNLGTYIGKVNNVKGSQFSITGDHSLKPGDGLFFTNNSGIEFGGKIYSISKDGFNISMGSKFSNSIIEGLDVYKNRDEVIIKEIAKSVTDFNSNKKVLIDIEFIAVCGEKFKLIAKDGVNSIEVFSENLVDKALSKPTSKEGIIITLNKLSRTVYKVNNFKCSVDSNAFIHLKELKLVKQQMVAKLNEIRTKVESIEKSPFLYSKFINKTSNESKINILVRKKEQTDELISYLANTPEYLKFINYIILDYEFSKDYFPSVKELKNKNIPVAIATTRIYKPKEKHNFTLIERCKPNAILIRNLGALSYFSEKSYNLIGDFSLNCSNSLSLDYLISKGLNSVTASYDLNISQLNDLIDFGNSEKLEITLHQYMPEFHMEHCVYAAFLSKGNSFVDCGKPCEKHDVFLVDMYGNRHDIKADQECRNTLFNSKAITTAKYLNDWTKMGVKFFRFECLHETGNEFITKLETYFKLLNNEISLEKTYKVLGKNEKYGLGSQVLDNKIEYSSIKK